MVVEITSRSNPRLKELLQNSSDYCFFEGEKLVRDILARKMKIDCLVIRSSQKARFDLNHPEIRECWLVNDSVLEKISQLKEAPDCLAVIKNFRKKVNFSKEKVVVLLDSIQDPANAGTIFRCASAFGINAVAFSGEGVKTNHPKFIRAAQTALLDLDFTFFDSIAFFIQSVRKHKYHIYLTASQPRSETVAIDQIRFPCAILFGNEGSGLPAELFGEYPTIRIPHHERMDSLNVGVSACIVMYELKRIFSSQ